MDKESEGLSWRLHAFREKVKIPQTSLQSGKSDTMSAIGTWEIWQCIFKRTDYDNTCMQLTRFDLQNMLSPEVYDYSKIWDISIAFSAFRKYPTNKEPNQIEQQ